MNQLTIRPIPPRKPKTEKEIEEAQKEQFFVNIEESPKNETQ